jgi:hypothetical protein
MHTLEIIGAPHIDHIYHSRSCREFFDSKEKETKRNKNRKKKRKELEKEKEKGKPFPPPRLGRIQPTQPRRAHAFSPSLCGPGGPAPRAARLADSLAPPVSDPPPSLSRRSLSLAVWPHLSVSSLSPIPHRRDRRRAPLAPSPRH